MARKAKGFNVKCVKCGQEECVSLAAHDLEQFSCSECGETFTAQDVVAMMKEWAALLKWIETAP